MAKDKISAAQQLYNLTNLNSTINKLLIKDIGSVSFRDLKNFVDTRVKMFSYKGLPNDLPPRVVRLALTFGNCMCFYKSNLYGIIFCRYVPTNVFTKYILPEYVDLYMLNGKLIESRVPYKDIVVVRDNELDIPPILWLNEYFTMQHNVENTLIKNLEVLKLPAVFSGNEKSVSTFKNIIKKAMDFDPFAVADINTADAFKQFNIELPVKLDEYISVYKNYKNMALESIAISGTETQKKERLLVGEVESQEEYVNIIYSNAKQEQLDWIADYNKRYNENVELIESLQEYKDAKLDFQEEETKRLANAENTEADTDE